MLLNLESTAINVLETTAYFQGKWTVDDYLDQFRNLIYNSGYTDPKTVMVKFRWGLDCWISTALAGMTYGRPSDTDPEAWFRLAVRMDQNHAADEVFHVSHPQPYVPMSLKWTSRVILRNHIRTHITNLKKILNMVLDIFQCLVY